jgi:hypothetical protein
MTETLHYHYRFCGDDDDYYYDYDDEANSRTYRDSFY